MQKTFLDKISEYSNGVILLEGTREVTATEFEALTQTGKKLATLLPNSIFRSGNAPGSDEGFIKGVNDVKGSTIQLILPFGNHRKQSLPSNAYVISLEELSAEELKEIIIIGSNANPKHSSLLSLYKPDSKNVLSTKASFLLRNVVKVTGVLARDFKKASAGVFQVNPQKKGGTEFTMNICKYLGVECFTQEDFLL